MPLTLDFSTDYELWDNPETITYTSVRDSGNVAVPITVAIRQQIGARELAASQGAYAGLDVHWFVPGPLLGALTPKPGDLIQDGNATIWTVLSQDYENLDQVYDFVARDPIIVFDLQDTLSVFTPLNTQDAAAGRLPSYVPKYQGVAAKVQEVSNDLEDRHGGTFRKRTYQVYLGQRLGVRPGEDLVQDQHGILYEIVDSTKPDLIGELQWLTCRIRG